jgi:hypothetical protein
MKKATLLALAITLCLLKLQAQNITGSGTTNYLPKFSGTTTVNSSMVYQTTTSQIGIGTTVPTGVLEIKNICQTTGLPALVLTNDNPCLTGSTGDLIIGRLYNSTLGTYSTRYIVTKLGLMGVNVAAPTSQLEVQSSGSSTNIALFKNNSGTATFSVLNSGNTGIGTASPTARFEIRNAVAGANPFQVYNASSASVFVMKNDGSIGVVQTTPTAMLDIKNNTINDDFRIMDVNNNTHFIIQNAGNVGIGVSNPTTYGGSLVVGAQGTGTNALDLVSTATTGWCNQLRFDNASGARHLIADDRTNNYLLIKTGYGGGAATKLRVEGNQDLTGNLAVSGTGTVTGATTLSSTLSVAGTSDFTGRVKIGNVTVPNANYMLFVEKGILAERFKCALKSDQTNWSDYVFEKDYKLMKLVELEKFVKKYKHLPNIPSAEQVYKEGIDLADMDALLLEKIEELTLYVIELEKKVELLKTQQPKW